MPAPFDNIVQHLFHQPSLQSVTVDELERMAQQHPYFAAAHFLLLKKMQDTAHPQFNSQLHKTTLYFNNPLWLQFLLQPESITNFTVSDKTPFIEDETTMQPVESFEEYKAENIPADTSSTEHQLAEQAPFAETVHENNEYTTEPVEEYKADNIPVAYQSAEQILLAEAAQENNEYTIDPSLTALAPAAPVQAQAGMMDLIMDVFDEDKTLAGQPIIEEVNTIVSEELPSFPDEIHATLSAEQTGEENITGSTKTTIPAEPPALTALESSSADITGEVSVQDADETNATPADEAMISGEEKPLLKTIIETAGAKNDLLFEPYHTVDYFASQGIKLSKMEADSKDKLGRQLKSFTEWLKTMKKLPQVSIDKILAQNEESKVVEDANHSIEAKEVITEAMAEVFEKQGLTEKAAEVYQKLSLLNPGKSAYFAARISALKH